MVSLKQIQQDMLEPLIWLFTPVEVTDCPPSWSAFNQTISTANSELTNVRYMPIIQASAHTIDALDTVVQRCMHV